MTSRAAGAAATLAVLAAALTGCPATRPLVRPAPSPPAHGDASPPPIPLGSPAGHDEPGVVGVVHVVRRGETLYRIAKAYGIDPADLMETNGIADPRSLAVGAELFVPGATDIVPGVAPSPPPSPPLRGGEGADSIGGAIPTSTSIPTSTPTSTPTSKPPLSWPLRGVLYGRFGVRAGERHDGIDIAAPEGTPVRAAADGTVVYVGEPPGYGSVVILRHDGGLVTVYAHNAAVVVKDGARVTRGEAIANVGQTGRTTGPHLHFEVREGTRPRNPLLFLP